MPHTWVSGTNPLRPPELGFEGHTSGLCMPTCSQRIMSKMPVLTRKPIIERGLGFFRLFACLFACLFVCWSVRLFPSVVPELVGWLLVC